MEKKVRKKKYLVRYAKVCRKRYVRYYYYYYYY
jgi:hypothetical protein